MTASKVAVSHALSFSFECCLNSSHPTFVIDRQPGVNDAPATLWTLIVSFYQTRTVQPYHPPLLAGSLMQHITPLSLCPMFYSWLHSQKMQSILKKPPSEAECRVLVLAASCLQTNFLCYFILASNKICRHQRHSATARKPAFLARLARLKM